jgi:hypothetical protein
LITLKIDTYPFELHKDEKQDVWRREKHHREFGIPHIIDRMGNESFVLVIADTDELLNRSAIATAKERYDELSTTPLFFEMLFHTYSFKYVKDVTTVATLAINDVYLKNHPQVSVHDVRFGKHDSALPNSGWHCSYFMSPEDALERLDSSAHAWDAVVDRKEIKNITWVRHAMSNGIDILNRPYDLTFTSTMERKAFLRVPLVETKF